jgi:1D-myo-inositol-triphosphate 3-kinase
LATLAAFGHGGGSSEDTYYFKPKRANDRGENEQRMLELFMKAQRRGEPIAEHAPEYHGLEARDGQPNFKMTNLIYDFVEPRLLDCKVGVRCHTESEATNAKLRTDLCERWRKMDPSVLTEEELERGSITKSRWMALRDSRSSTQRLGFRIDAVATPHGHKTAFDSELHSVREDQHVLETFRWFLPQAAECEGCHPREIAGEILVKLRRLETALRAWADFWHNEFIGSSVLFMADATGRADLKMIDFGVTTPCEAGLKHDTPWVMGNHEDGYLLGLANLIRLWNQLLVEDVWL